MCPHWGNQGRCNLLSVKYMKRGHGDTALNLYSQVHQRVIQMNPCEGQGRWGRSKRQRRPWKKTDISFLPWIVQREIVFSLCKNIHIPQSDLSAPFLFPWLSSWSNKTQALYSISLIRWKDTNNQRATARLRERCAKRKTLCAFCSGSVWEGECLGVCDCTSTSLKHCWMCVLNLKEVNEQTTAASIAEEQEHDEWEENEQDEEKRIGRLLVLIWASVVCASCASVLQMKMGECR